MCQQTPRLGQVHHCPTQTRHQFQAKYTAEHLHQCARLLPQDQVENDQKSPFTIKPTFEKYAKEFSTGPTGKNGGYLGKFSPKKMVPEFSAAAMKLNKGEYTKTPVKTQFGFHIIFLESKLAATTLAYDSVKAKIKQGLVQEKYAKLIKGQAAKLREKAKIVIK